MGKFKDRRGQRVKGGKQKNDDFYRIRVVLFLSAFDESRITDMREKGEYGLGTMNKGSLLVLLEKMIEDKWIKRTISEDSKNVKRYSLNKKGTEMRDFIRHLRDSDPNNSLLDCDLFLGVRSLG